MSKIRINELARELEVKPTVILDLLPELGINDKKTHSSSLDDDVALELRRRVAAGEGQDGSSHEETPSSPEPQQHAAESHAPTQRVVRPHEESHAPAPKAEPEKKE